MKCPHGVPFDEKCEFCEIIRQQALGVSKAVTLPPPTLAERIPGTPAWRRRRRKKKAIESMIKKAQKAWAEIMRLRDVAQSSRDQ